LGGLDDVTVTWVGDTEATDSEVFTAGSTELDVVSRVVVDSGFAQHSVVLDFGSSESWGVRRQDDEFALGSSKLSESLSVSQAVFTGLHDQLKSRVDGLGGVSFFWHVERGFCSQLKWKKTQNLERALTPPCKTQIQLRRSVSRERAKHPRPTSVIFIHFSTKTTQLRELKVRIVVREIFEHF